MKKENYEKIIAKSDFDLCIKIVNDYIIMYNMKLILLIPKKYLQDYVKFDEKIINTKTKKIINDIYSLGTGNYKMIYDNFLDKEFQFTKIGIDFLYEYTITKTYFNDYIASIIILLDLFKNNDFVYFYQNDKFKIIFDNEKSLIFSYNKIEKDENSEVKNFKLKNLIS